MDGLRLPRIRGGRVTALRNHGPESLPQACLGATSFDWTDPLPHPTTARYMATTYCDGCPVKDLCLSTAVRERASGVWAGVWLRGGRPYTLDVYENQFAWRQRIAA
jgi:hypothetical protein